MAAKFTHQELEIRGEKIRAAIIAMMTQAGRPVPRAEFAERVRQGDFIDMPMTEQNLDNMLSRQVQRGQWKKTKEGYLLANGEDKKAQPAKKAAKKKAAIPKGKRGEVLELGERIRAMVLQMLGEKPMERGEMLEALRALRIKTNEHALSQQIYRLSKLRKIVRGEGFKWVLASQASQGQESTHGRFWLEYILHAGNAKVAMTDADCEELVKVMTGRRRL